MYKLRYHFLQFSKGVYGCSRDFLHVTQRNTLLQKPDLLRIFFFHLLITFLVSGFPADLAAVTSKVVVAAFHPAADKTTFHLVELPYDTQNKLSNGVHASIPLQGFQAVLVNV